MATGVSFTEWLSDPVAMMTANEILQEIAASKGG